MKYLIFSAVLLILITGCATETPANTQGKDEKSGQHVITNPTAEEVLAGNADADIFVANNTVYVNAENIDWVKELNLTLGNIELEIISQSNKGEDFVEGTASKLPVGTKIYKPVEKGNIYIAVVDGAEIRYLGWVEG